MLSTARWCSQLAGLCLESALVTRALRGVATSFPARRLPNWTESFCKTLRLVRVLDDRLRSCRGGSLLALALAGFKPCGLAPGA